MADPARVGAVVDAAADGAAVPGSNRAAGVHRVAAGRPVVRAVGTASARPADEVEAWVRQVCGAAVALQRVGEAHTVQIAPRCAQVTGVNPPRTNVPMLSKADANASHRGE